MRFTAYLFAASSVMAGSMLTFGQTTRPATDPAATGPSTIDLTQNQAPVITAADAVDTIREGTHFVDRIGRITRTSNGQQMIINFVSDGSEATNPRMIVQPNSNLFKLESVAAVRGTSMPFRVSGTVTEYKGMNYILLDNVHDVSPSTTAAALPAKSLANQTSRPQAWVTPPPVTAPAVTAPAGSAQATMSRLLAPLPTEGQELPVIAGVSSASDASTGKASVAPNSPELRVVREGTHLINRVGRLNHSPDGKQAFLTFEADGKAMQDPPMIILPNIKLSAMEGAVVTGAHDAHFRVSGTVTEYRGRNYILLDKAVVMVDIETQF